MKNEDVLKHFSGYGLTAKIKVNYNQMKGSTYECYEIVGTRVTIKLDRLIDFHISEVELKPKSYCPKEYEQIQLIYKTFKK